jgi:hypothetical protein
LVKAYTGLGAIHEQADQVDSIAIEWGFEEEIKAANEYKKEMDSEKKGHPLTQERRVIPTQTQGCPCLIMRNQSGGERRVYKIEDGAASIGRHPDNDIVLDDPYVSKNHAEIRQENNGCFIYDYASKNGTRVNGQTIRTERIVDADIIEIGHSTFIFLSKEVS